MTGSNTPDLSALAMKIPPILLKWAFGLLLVLFLMYLLLTGSGTVAITLMIASTFLALIVYQRTAAVYMAVAYLMVMGDLRKVRDLAFPHPSLDALLLVPPAVVIALAVPLLMRARFHDRTC